MEIAQGGMAGKKRVVLHTLVTDYRSSCPYQCAIRRFQPPMIDCYAAEPPFPQCDASLEIALL